MNEVGTVYLIDGHFLIFRAYHALPDLRSPAKEPVGAVYGFAQSLIKFVLDLKPVHIAIAFDHDPVLSFRTVLYSAYKAQRGRPVEELAIQFPHCRQVAELLGVSCFDAEGFEADDLIATIIKKLEGQADFVVISQDKDFAQLVGPGILLRDFSGKSLLGAEGVRERFGVHPWQIPDFQALVGDAVDNIPGVAGIGPKIARLLLERFENLEEILAHLNDVRKLPIRGAGALADRLAAEAEQARLFLTLTRLYEDVPLQVSLPALRYRGAVLSAKSSFERLGLGRLVERIPVWNTE